MLQRGYDIVAGKTENHLFLVNLAAKDLTGKDAEYALGQANITVNKNTVPNDPRPPFVTSGLRVGTPAVTTRGFKEQEVRDIANWICDVLDDLNNTQTIERVKKQVLELCNRFPVYPS